MGIHIGSSAARSSRPKGDSRIYSMRFLINPNGRYIGCRLCATRHLCSSGGDFRSAMVRMMSVSHSRVMCCSGPSARTLVLSLLMCQPSLAMVLPAVARASPSRAFTGLRHANFFRETFATRSRSMGPSVHVADSALTASTLSTGRDEYVPPNLPTRTFEVAVLLNPFAAGKGGEGHPLISALDEYLYLKWAIKHNMQTTTTTYNLPVFGFFDPVSVYACFAFQAGGVPRPAGRGFLRPLDSMDEAFPITVSGRTTMMALLLAAPLPMKIRVFAFLFNLEPVGATITCPHCKDTILPAHAATSCPLMTELTRTRRSSPGRSWAPRRRWPTR